MKDQVETRWRDDEIAKRLKAKADDMVGKLKAGTALTQLATDTGLKVVTATDLQRGKPGGFAPAKLVEAVFKTPKGVPANSGGDQETMRFVFRVTDVVDPALDPVASKAISTSLLNSYTDDIVGAYVTRLESDFGVTLNQQALNQVIGGLPASPARPTTTDPMQIEPSETAFAERYSRGQTQVVWTTLVADLETPVSAFLKLGGGKPMSFLLESVEGGAVRGRHSIIGIDPDLIWRANGARAEVNRSARSKPDAFVPCPEPPLKALRTLIAESRIALPDSLPPMAAGVFGYLGYDMVRLMEELPPPNPDPIGIPDAVLVRPTIIVVFDAVKDSITVVTPVRPEKGVDAKTALTRAVERLSGILESLDRPLDKSLAEYDEGPLDVPPRSNTTPDEYKAMVRKAKDYIAAGDAFQIVLAQRFEAPFSLPPFSLYRALRRTNPSPYLYFLDFGGFAIAGSSPEILVKVTGDVVTIRPIAGTRPRGNTPHEDKALGRRTARRSEGARRAPDAARSRPQRCRPRRRDRQRDRHRSVFRRALQPCDAHRLQCRGQARGQTATRSMRWPPDFPPARCRARRKCAPCRSSTNWRRKSAGSTPARSAIFPPPARWTPALCCAPRW